MENVKEITIIGFDGKEETHKIIEHLDGSYTSMLKSTWDELQANQNNGGLN